MEQDERIKAVADEAWVSMLGDLEAVGVKLQRVSVAAGGTEDWAQVRDLTDLATDKLAEAAEAITLARNLAPSLRRP